MLDIKLIRLDPNKIKSNLSSRSSEYEAIIDEILILDQEIRNINTELQNLQAKSNKNAEEIAIIKKNNGDKNDLENKQKLGDEFKNKSRELSDILSQKQEIFDDKFARIPNTLQEDVPNGKDDSNNLVIKQNDSHKKNLDFKPKMHYEIGQSLGLIDTETAAKISGSRFSFLYGILPKLERALISFMLTEHTKGFGYEEVSVPFLVRKEALFGTGQWPKFDNGYQTTDDMFLIPTSEVSLTNLVRDSICKNEELPKRFVASTPCFRSESGSAGRDVKGIIRQHQFHKVELVSVTNPEKSKEEHERMMSAVENVLNLLELPYRISLLCSGDTGFCSSKTYDFEVWLPGEGRYLEISSCSNMWDFQARRMMARYKDLSDGKNKFVHTLNGSGVAIGRAIVAIIENYQTSSGNFEIPAVLNKYL
jgi:seryl-tRNA synthetase